jgi:hypothetical protein
MNETEMSKTTVSGKKQRIFLASPYTHENKEVMTIRYEAALKATAKLIQEGNIVFSPIVHCHPVAVIYDLPKSYSFWQAYTQSFIVNWAEVFSILCLEDWENSTGIKEESILAREIGLSFSHIYLGN